jgi:hypothetical protein
LGKQRGKHLIDILQRVPYTFARPGNARWFFAGLN